jgi:ferredoxin
MISLTAGRIIRTPVFATSIFWHKPVRDVGPIIAGNTIKDRMQLTSTRNHGDHSGEPGTIPVHFILKDNTVIDTLAREGEIALRLAQRHDIPMEGACEASLACTTCHCYVEDEKHWDLLPEATDTEEDLLDQAPFLDVNSRLGCQIIITKELSGIRLRLPRATKNFYVDGHVPQPH